MKKAIVILVLLALLVVGCGDPQVERADAAEGREMELTPIWTFSKHGATHTVYEFTDLERGQHCYVMFPKSATYGVALSCESIRE